VTLLPNAFSRSVSSVPYFRAKASSPPSRSVQHCLAAFLNSVAASWSRSSAACSLAFAFWETHLPNAFRCLSFSP
jgi:hypothetical protein